jgi:hypothetical protein
MEPRSPFSIIKNRPRSPVTKNKTAIAFSKTTRWRSHFQKQQDCDRPFSSQTIKQRSPFTKNKSVIALHKEQNRDRPLSIINYKTAIALSHHKQQNSDRPFTFYRESCHSRRVTQPKTKLFCLHLF